jgi:hypothetical protein
VVPSRVAGGVSLAHRTFAADKFLSVVGRKSWVGDEKLSEHPTTLGHAASRRGPAFRLGLDLAGGWKHRSIAHRGSIAHGDVDHLAVFVGAAIISGGGTIGVGAALWIVAHSESLVSPGVQKETANHFCRI